jgi:poly-gamma-glutamate capsule biosynthesis protein CapA/YwtB (metallophosphatase superfamily)
VLDRSARMTTLFVCGDVMTGRGVDQILAHPSAPQIQEPYARDARDYVALAEEANGPIARPVSPAYVWGDALQELERVVPEARSINLETSVTTSTERAAPVPRMATRWQPRGNYSDSTGKSEHGSGRLGHVWSR